MSSGELASLAAASPSILTLIAHGLTALVATVMVVLLIYSMAVRGPR